MNQTFYEVGTCPEPGQKVQTVRLGSTEGMLIGMQHLEVRRLGKGVVKTWVAGHGGDVWFVAHPDGTVGAYCTDEMCPVNE